MRSELVTIASLTQAYRAKDLLEKYHISSNIVPASKDFSKAGCGYSLLVTGDLNLAHTLLKKAGITVSNF